MSFTQFSNHYFFQKQKGLIDLSSDTIKAILMGTGFTFDPDAHATLADVTVNQLATGNGYTQNDKVLTVASHTEDDVNNRSIIIYNSFYWSATPGAIGPAKGVIYYDDTTSDDTIIGYYDFEGTIEIAAGFDFIIPSLQIIDRQGS